MLKSKTKILITGGGSGGHISVAKGLVTALLDDYNIPQENIIYVGGDLGMEGEKVGNSLEMKQFKNEKIKKYFIRAGKLQRKISLGTIKLLLRFFLGFFDSISIIRKVKPDIVISTGGFVSVPVCIVAQIFRKPIYLHEQTASVGLSNKIVGKFADRVYVSFEESLKYFKKEKAVHVGNVLRKAIFQTEGTKNTDKEIISLNEKNKVLPFIYISGGSLGSHLINEKVFQSLISLLTSYKVLLQTGDNEILKDYEKALDHKNSMSEEFQERFVVKKYIDDDSIGYVFHNMDIFIGRSGANTVYEIGVLRKYALFIPIPWVTHNEQYLNAKVLEEIGTAKILEEKYLKDASLKKELDRLISNLNIKRVNIQKLEKLFPTNAVYNILEDIFKRYQKR